MEELLWPSKSSGGRWPCPWWGLELGFKVPACPNHSMTFHPKPRVPGLLEVSESTWDGHTGLENSTEELSGDFQQP